jgi:hypothetical protein
VPGYVRHLLGGGLPLDQALVQTVLHFGLRLGQAETVDPTLGQLLGRPPGTMASYIHDSREMWSPADQPAVPIPRPHRLFGSN